MSMVNIDFGKIAYCGNRKVNKVVVRVELKNNKENKPVFSASAMVYNARGTDCVAGGQCLDTLKKFFRGNKKFNDILGLWERNHLNDMHTGTPEQEKAIKESEENGLFAEVEEKLQKELDEKWTYCKHTPSWYDVACEVLKQKGLYEVQVEGKPYQYGHGWLYESISDDDLKLINSYIAA